MAGHRAWQIIQDQSRGVAEWITVATWLDQHGQATVVRPVLLATDEKVQRPLTRNLATLWWRGRLRLGRSLDLNASLHFARSLQRQLQPHQTHFSAHGVRWIVVFTLALMVRLVCSFVLTRWDLLLDGIGISMAGSCGVFVISGWSALMERWSPLPKLAALTSSSPDGLFFPRQLSKNVSNAGQRERLRRHRRTAFEQLYPLAEWALLGSCLVGLLVAPLVELWLRQGHILD